MKILLFSFTEDGQSVRMLMPLIRIDSGSVSVAASELSATASEVSSSELSKILSVGCSESTSSLSVSTCVLVCVFVSGS